MKIFADLKFHRLIISAAILFCYDNSYCKQNIEAGIRAGISREILDYENENDNLALRGGTSVMLYDRFTFNATALRNIDKDTSSCTWNISAKNIAGNCDFTAGNYTLHFGSGLMMGKPSFSTSDPFRKKLSISREKTVSLSNGGNPSYSLYGTAMNLHTVSGEINFSLLPFFSMQKRYTTAESSEERVIESSLFSLNSKILKSGNNTVPANIFNYGCAARASAFSLFTFQIYYFETDLKDTAGNDILWDRNKSYGGSGIDLIRNSGLFMEYADNNISLFLEPAFSSIRRERTVSDTALTYGLTVQNALLNFSLKGKNCGENFHSEYSTGSRTPERIWDTRLGICPTEILEAGIGIYSEKELVPAYNKKYTEGSVQEEIFASVNTEPADINFSFRRREHYSTDRADTADQMNFSLGLSPSERLFLKIRSSAQKKSESLSYLYGGEIKFLFLGYMTFSAGYTRIVVNGESPFYAVISPSSGGALSSAYREPVHGWSILFKYRKEKDSFHIKISGTRGPSGDRAEAESALALFF